MSTRKRKKIAGWPLGDGKRGGIPPPFSSHMGEEKKLFTISLLTGGKK